jgi:hypothetical protein
MALYRSVLMSSRTQISVSFFFFFCNDKFVMMRWMMSQDEEKVRSDRDRDEAEYRV